MNRFSVVTASILVLITVSLLLMAAAPSKAPAYIDVKAVAATYPSSAIPYACNGSSTARAPIRMMISAIDTTTGLGPANQWTYSVSFMDTVANIPDANFSNFPTAYDRNCLCEMPGQATGGEAAATTFVMLPLDLRYTGSGSCNGFPMGLNNCQVPDGDYRFTVSVQGATSGGATVGTLQVRGGGGQTCAPQVDLSGVTF